MRGLTAGVVRHPWQNVVLVVTAQGQQREVGLFGDAAEIDRLVQGASRDTNVPGRSTATEHVNDMSWLTAINLTVQALVATMMPDPAQLKAPEASAPSTSNSGAATKANEPTATAAAAKPAAAPIKRWGKPSAPSTAIASSIGVRHACPLIMPSELGLTHINAQTASTVDDSSDAGSESSGDGEDFPLPAAPSGTSAPAAPKPAVGFTRTTPGSTRTFGAGFGRGAVARPSITTGGVPAAKSALATDSSEGSEHGDDSDAEAEPETRAAPQPAAAPPVAEAPARVGGWSRKPAAEVEPPSRKALVPAAAITPEPVQQEVKPVVADEAPAPAPFAPKRSVSARTAAPVPVADPPPRSAAADEDAIAASQLAASQLAEAQAALRRAESALRAKESELFETRQRALDASAERDSLRASLASAQELSRASSNATASERAAAAAAVAAAADERAAVERRCAALERDLREERAAKQAALEQAQREMDRAAALQRAADAATRVAEARGGVDPALLADPSLDVAVQGALVALTGAHQSAVRQLERATADLVHAKAVAKETEARAEAAEAASLAASQGERNALEEIAKLRPALEIAQRVGSAAAERSLGDARRRIGELERTLGSLEEELSEREDQLQAAKRSASRADEARRAAEAALASERQQMQQELADAKTEAAECRSLLERSQSAGALLAHDELTRRLDAERSASATARHVLEELLEKLSRAESALAEKERRVVTQQHDAAAAAAVAAAENTALREAEARAAAAYARAAAELAELRALVGPGGITHAVAERTVATPAVRAGGNGLNVAASPAVERLFTAEQDNRVLRARLEALARSAPSQPSTAIAAHKISGYVNGAAMQTPASAVHRAADLQQRVADLREALATTGRR